MQPCAVRLTRTCSVCLVSIFRTVWLSSLLYSKNVTWDYVLIANWSLAETNTAIVCACLPTLKPALRKVFGPLMRRYFPHQPVAENPTNQPRTIGSMPMRTFKFKRQTQTDTFVSLNGSQSTWVDEAAWSQSRIETGRSGRDGPDPDPEAGSIGGDRAAVMEPGRAVNEPPEAHVRH